MIPLLQYVPCTSVLHLDSESSQSFPGCGGFRTYYHIWRLWLVPMLIGQCSSLHPAWQTPAASSGQTLYIQLFSSTLTSYYSTDGLLQSAQWCVLLCTGRAEYQIISSCRQHQSTWIYYWFGTCFTFPSLAIFLWQLWQFLRHVTDGDEAHQQ